jgi:hypothetical protein
MTEPRPLAYLYHDAARAEDASPLMHSTLLVLAADRRPQCRNETPLYAMTQAQMEAISSVLADAMTLYPGSRQTPDYAVEVAMWMCGLGPNV